MIIEGKEGEGKGLLVLDMMIFDRVNSIERCNDDWPCRKGCDACCRSLAARPELTDAEWDRVEAGVAKLGPDAQQEIAERMAAIESQAAGPYVCPFLDLEQGACRIYEHRPLACRTYGFYVDDRGVGLYCGEIKERVESGRYADVVWGNQTALDARVESELGPRSFRPQFRRAARPSSSY